MDHLCELPNDAARRKALNALPPTLHATYERILQRVNKCSKEVQQLVQRSLRWLLCSKQQLTSLALCEAVSIESGDTTLDRAAVPEEEEILRRCSSLVRRSVSGKSLEIAHFTVKEFLTTGIDPLDKEYNFYHVRSEIEDVELAKTCLTYLSFDEFGSGNRESLMFSHERFRLFALRQYAVRNWAEHAREHLANKGVMSLVDQLLHPSKPLHFVSWTQDFFWAFHGYRTLEIHRKTSMADLTSMSPLHFAALLSLPESCKSLLQKGCYVDQMSACGTPLECALRGDEVFNDKMAIPRRSVIDTVEMIIDHGANVQKGCLQGPSYFFLALNLCDEDSCIELLRNGAIIDPKSAEMFAEDNCRYEYLSIAHEAYECLGEDEIRPEDRTILLEAALRSDELAENPSFEVLSNRSGDFRAAHINYLSLFLTAAEYGQLSVLKQIFRDHKLHVDATGHCGQRSGLHLAASNDHIKIVEFLHEHGADLNLTDRQGRTPLHASVENSGRYLCLQFFLNENVNIHSTDNDGLTAWHLAALKGNAHALSVLKDSVPWQEMCLRLKDNDGRTPLHYGAQSCSKETLIFLLDHSDKDAIHDKSSDGMTALHYWVKGCSLKRNHRQGSDALEVLLEHGANLASEDLMGSTALARLVEMWEEFFLIAKDLGKIDTDMSDEFMGLFSKMMENTKNVSFPAYVCKDPHYLCLALIFGQEHLAKEILKHSPSVDAIAYRILQWSPLRAACYYGRCSRPLLEELQGRSNAERGTGGVVSGLLLIACAGAASRMKQVVTDLLALGSDPNDRSAEGQTAMMLAAKGGHVAVVKMLIDHGGDVSTTDNNGWSVTHYACLSESEGLLYSLMNITNDWDAKVAAMFHGQWSYNATALHLAAALPGNALKFLLTNDLTTDINSLTKRKETALYLAAFFGMSNNVSLLLDNGANTTIRDCCSEAPLHVAIRRGNLEVVTTFMDKECDLSLQDGSGFTPQLIARKYGHLDIAELLKERTSDGGMKQPIHLDLTHSKLTSTRYGYYHG